jgi:hypothetical protein
LGKRSVNGPLCRQAVEERLRRNYAKKDIQRLMDKRFKLSNQ